MASRGISGGGAGPGCRRARLGGCGGAGRLHVRGAAARRRQAHRHGVRGDALLDQHGDGRAGRRGALDGHGRAAAGPRPGGRQAVRGPDVDRQPGLLRRPPGAPGHVAAGQRPARGRSRKRHGRRQGRAGDRLPDGRAVADELPADQPGRAQAGVRDRRGQPGRRGQPLRRRRAQQRRPAAPGRHPAVPGRREPRRHPRQGRVQERPDGAHPVRAADARGPRGPGAGQPAVDQQVLRHGPGARPQLPGVGGPARAHRVRDLLPQPGRLHGRRHPGRLPHPRPAGSARRHRRDHRRAQDRHHRPVPRRRPDRHAGGLPHREGRRQDRLDHAAQHPAGLQRARHPRRLHRREDGGPAGEADGGEGRPGGQPDGGHLRHAARQRPDLQLRGLELADGPGAAGVRHPGLERRQHPHAGRHALVLPALAVHAQRAGPGRAGAGRPAAVAVRRKERHVRGGRDQRSHRALARRPTRPAG